MFGQICRFRRVHYIVLQYILAASRDSTCKMNTRILFAHPFRCLQGHWLPRAFFCGAPTVLCNMRSANVTANNNRLQIIITSTFLKLRNKLLTQFVGRSPDELSQRHALGLALASLCVARSNTIDMVLVQYFGFLI